MQLVASTPCLFEFRSWFFSVPRSAQFQPPPGLTEAQCAHARLVHEQIQQEQADDAAQADSLAQARQDQIIAEHRRQFDELEAQRLRDAEAHEQRMREIDHQVARQQAARRVAAKALAAKPAARLGMSPAEVRSATNWGAPRSTNTTTTAEGVREFWWFPARGSLLFVNGRLAVISEER